MVGERRAQARNKRGKIDLMVGLYLLRLPPSLQELLKKEGTR
jgi:hypothetical protein